MHTIKTTISILVAGLLLGAAGGVAAQDEEVPAAVTTFTGVFSPDGEPLPGQGEEIIHPNGFLEGRPGFTYQAYFPDPSSLQLLLLPPNYLSGR